MSCERCCLRYCSLLIKQQHVLQRRACLTAVGWGGEGGKFEQISHSPPAPGEAWWTVGAKALPATASACAFLHWWESHQVVSQESLHYAWWGNGRQKLIWCPELVVQRQEWEYWATFQAGVPCKPLHSRIGEFRHILLHCTPTSVTGLGHAFH